MQNSGEKVIKFNKDTFWALYGIPIALIIICVVLIVTTKSFASMDNVFNILRQISILTIAAMGTTLILISGGIDISMGSVMAFSGVVSIALIVDAGIDYRVAILVALCAGALVGALNGVLVTVIKIPPFIATLGTMQMVRGLCFVYTGGYSLYGDIPQAFTNIGRGYIGVVPVPVIIMVLAVVVFYLIANYTKIGIYTYSIGCNEKASRLSGINVKKVRLILYTLAGVMSALAGVLLSARLNSAQANVANGFEFDILTAVVLGGTSIYGGKGNIARTMLGAIVIGVINNGMTLLNVNTFYQMIANGAILVLAIALDRINAKD